MWAIILGVAVLVWWSNQNQGGELSPASGTDQGGGGGDGSYVTMTDSNGNSYSVDGNGNIVNLPSGGSIDSNGEAVDGNGIPLALYPARPSGGDP